MKHMENMGKLRNSECRIERLTLSFRNKAPTDNRNRLIIDQIGKETSIIGNF